MSEEFKAGFVAIVGRPNVGKSTLINALLGQKIAAVSPRPQTTRRQQLGILTTDDYQMIFTDTPGMHDPVHRLGRYMNEEAQVALEEDDVIVFVVDVSAEPHEDDQLIADLLKEVSANVPVILALNKTDQVHGELLENNQAAYQALAPHAYPLRISAQHGENLPALTDAILERLPDHPPFYPPDQVTDLYEREIAADLIREAALYILREEIPHSLAVRMDAYTERGAEGAHIEATLLVERDSQKGIVIGKGGEMIKQISTRAREEIEKMSGRKVFLRMRVKVRKNWRNDDSTLSTFGFRRKPK